MTDYFALLDQPRRPWLDPDELKEAFHAKSLQLHPDAQRADGAATAVSDSAFAELNDAYQVLQDPKRRIQHLLSLEGRMPPRDASVPHDLADLFPVIASITHAVEPLLEKFENATNPLSRSLLKPQVLYARTRVDESLQRLRELHANSTDELRRLSSGREPRAEDWAALHDLYLRFSYLSRWMSELEDKQVKLANT